MINGDPTKEQLEAVRNLYAPDADAERFNNLFMSNPSWQSKVMGVIKGADLELYNSVNASLQAPTEDSSKKKEETAKEEETQIDYELKQEFDAGSAGFSVKSYTGKRRKESATQEEPSEDTPPRGARISNGKLLPIQIAPEEQEVPQEGYQSVTDATQVVIPGQQDLDDRLSSEAYNKIMYGISEKRYQDIQDGRVNKVSTELSSSREIGKGQGMDFSFKMESPNGKVLEEESMSFEVPDGSTMEYFSTELTRFLASINPMQEESYIRRMESDPAYVQKVRELRGKLGKEYEINAFDEEGNLVISQYDYSKALDQQVFGASSIQYYTEKDFDREVEELREATIDGYREETRESVKEQVLSILPDGATEEEINALDDVLFEAGVALDLAGDGKYKEQPYGKDLAMSLASGLVQAAKPFVYIQENFKGGMEGLFSKDETILEGIERRGSQFRKVTEDLIDEINENRTIYHDSIVDSFSNGDYQNAFAQIGTSVVESLPITAEIIALNATGVGAGAVPWLIGGQVGVSTWMEVADDPTMSPEAKFGYVLSSAGAEAAFALVGTRIQMRAQMREMGRAAIAGNTSARSTLKGIVQGMGIQRGINSMIEGGTEEFFIEFLNAMSKDIAMGNPFDFEKYFDAGLESMFVGMGSAGVFSAAGTIQGGLKAIRNNNENPTYRDMKAALESRKLEIEKAIREESNVTVKKALMDELNGVSRELEQIESRAGDMVAIMLMNNSQEAMSMLSMMDQAAETKRAYNNASTDVAKKALKDKYDKLQEDIKNTFEAFKDENPDDYREAIDMINNGWTPKEARLWQDVLEARREAAASKPNLSTVDSFVEPPTEGRTETPKKKSVAEAEQAFADGTGVFVDEVRSEGFDPNNRTIEMAGFSLRNPFKKKKRVFRDQIKEETTITERFNSDVDKFLTKTKRLWLQTFFSGSGLPKNISEKIREMQRQGDVLTDELKTDIILFKEIFEGADSKTMELLADFQSDTNPDSKKALMRESMTPEQLEVIYYMRGKIDRLSDKLIEHLSRVEGNEKLIETIQSNKGSYLLRSYRIFNDSKYIENITKDYDKMPASFKERYDNAINFVMEENNVGREVATNIVSEYITQVTDKGMSAITAGDLNVNKGSLTQRQMISEPFRELMGEVKDPILKYAQTVTNLTNMVNSMEYQQQLYQILKDMDIISDFKRKNSDTLLVGTERDVKREKMSTSDQVSIFDPERSRVEPTQRLGIEPLYGKYVNKEFKAAFDSMGPLKSVQEMDFMWRTIIKATSNTKYYKTVLSPTTTLRNIYSGMFLSIGAGHMPFTKNAWEDLGTAWGSKKSRKERQAERSKLISLGVLGDGASSGEVMALMKDISKDFSSVTGDMSRYKKMMEFTQRFYAIGDDFFKVSGFYQEKAALMKSGMTEAEAETKAAERIRNGYPTYSYLPKNMQKLRRNPFFGTFIAFPYESVRATKNNFKFAIEDMMAGRKAMAAKRIAGLAVSSLGFTVLANTIRDMFKLDEEDEAFLRFIAPEWQTNSQLLVLNNDKGELSYVDLSFMAPSATVVKPATALLKPTKEDRDPMDVFLEVTGEVVDPYTSVDLTAQTFTDLLNNTDEFGQKIYNGEAVSKDATNGATDMLANADVVLAYMSKKIGPGFMSNLSEFLRSNGLVEEYVGSELTKYKRYTNQEAVAALLGFRTSSVPIPASVSFKAMDLAQTMKDYKTMELNEVIDMESEVPLSDLVDVASEYIRLATEYNKNLHYLVESGSRLMDKGDAANSRKTLVTSMKGVTGISDYRSQLLKGEMPDTLMLPYPKDSKGTPRLTRVENVILKRMGSVWLDQLNQLQEDNENYPSSFKANAKRFYDELPPEVIESINSRVFRIFFINEIVDQYNETGVIPEAGSQFLTDGDRRKIDKATKELFIKVLTKYGEKE